MHRGAVELLARKVDGSVVNAGDGAHEHPTQSAARRADHPPQQGPARRASPSRSAATVMHSRVARPPISSCSTPWAPGVRVVAPLHAVCRAAIERMGVEVRPRHAARGLNGADIVMMLRLQARSA